MFHPRRWILAAMLATTAASGIGAATMPPPTGVPASEAEGLSSGAGMGLARSAEMNGHPGPLHVLELADALGLTPDQRTATEALPAAMRDRAQALGRAILEEERSLDRLFAGRVVDPAAIRASVERIAMLRGSLRLVHLEAHLAQRRLLSAEQIARYSTLRGIAPATGHHHH